MTAPRFRVAGRTLTGGGLELRWQLLAGNSHVLGRSPGTFDDVELCRASLVVLRERMSEAARLLTPEGPAGTWWWHLVVDDDGVRSPLASSARGYERQRETRYNLAQFLLAAQRAPAAADVVLRPAPRTLRLPDHAGQVVVLDDDQGPGASAAAGDVSAAAGSPAPR